MSDPSEEDYSKICRDFLRGTCERKFCKFKHNFEMKQLNFCHDFQNTVCPRGNCKFIHCTADEESEYKTTGVMSNDILAEATRKNQLPGCLPICHAFRKGTCRRPYCKYRHISREEEDAEIVEIIQNNQKKLVLNETQMSMIHRRNNISINEYEECGIPYPKRRFMGFPEPEIISNGDLHPMEASRLRPVFKGYYTANPPPPIMSRVDRTLMLEEENNLLHKEIAQLKRQVSDLTATNEFLLDQNANLRVNNKRNEAAVTMPAVTITSTHTPQVIRTVGANVTTVPVSLATVSACNPVSVSIAGCPTVSMSQPTQILAPSQQILVTTNPTSQLTIANSSQAQLAIAQLPATPTQPQLTSQPQQLLAAATTQLTLANTQQTPQGQIALTGMPQQLLAPQNPQIEIHRTANSQAIAMTNGSQPMVSYPMMTQLAR